MVENNNKKYYTNYELVDLINDETSEIHKVWKEKFSRNREVVLLEQVNRLVYEGKKNKTISYVEFTRGENGKKKYYAFLLEDVIEYIQQRERTKKACNVKFIDKE